MVYYILYTLPPTFQPTPTREEVFGHPAVLKVVGEVLVCEDVYEQLPAGLHPVTHLVH